MSRKQTFIWACCLLLAACKPQPATEARGADDKAPVQLPIARVTRRDLADSLSLPGTVAARPDHSVKVGPAVAGKLVEVAVVPGDRVQAGQAVARLDARPAQEQAAQAAAALRVAEAGVQQARTNLLLARNTLDRERKLFLGKIAAQKDVIAAQSQVQTAQGQLSAAQAQADQARAALAQARVQAGYTAVRSPIAGVVAKRFLNVGDNADASAPVVQVVDLRTVVVTAQMPADTLHPVHVGQLAAIHTAALPGSALPARVTAVSPIVNPQNNSLDVQLRGPNPGERLKEGQAVTVVITTALHRGTLTVPKDALVPDAENPDRTMIYKVIDGKMQRVLVKTGLAIDQQVEILSGLKAGDAVVARGAYGLPDGTPIKAAAR